MAELAQASLVGGVVHAHIGWATHRRDRLRDHFFCLRGALLGHQHYGILRPGFAHPSRRQRQRKTQRQSRSDRQPFQPHSTAPPLTFSTSPVMNVDKSDATKSSGPAISSADATRPSGIVSTTSFIPDLVLSVLADMSVSTQPGATQFTNMLCGASSVDRPFTKLMTAPLLAP